jgi:hypothetical protein
MRFKKPGLEDMINSMKEAVRTFIAPPVLMSKVPQQLNKEVKDHSKSWWYLILFVLKYCQKLDWLFKMKHRTYQYFHFMCFLQGAIF